MRSVLGARGAAPAALLVAAGLLYAGGPWVATDASAQALTDGEFACQVATSKSQGKFTVAKTRCVTRCEQNARRGRVPFTDCDPPFAGDALGCVSVAESKAVAGEASNRSCVADCPDCFAGGNCPVDASARTAATEGQVDATVTAAYCDDSGSGDGLTRAEARCADTVARSLASFTQKKMRCYESCWKAVRRGTTSASDCVPPASGRTEDCIRSAEQRAESAIERSCDDSQGGEAPECMGFVSGSALVAGAEATVDAGQAGLFCGS